jgi:hypothetical protein
VAAGRPPQLASDSKLLEWFPKSIREFSIWDGSKNSVAFAQHWGPIHRCSRNTINAHVDLKNEIEILLERLVATSLLTAAAEVTEPTSSALLAAEKRRRVSIEREFLAIRKRFKSAEAHGKRLARLREVETREAKEKIRALERETKRLKKMNRELIRGQQSK